MLSFDLYDPVDPDVSGILISIERAKAILITL